MKIASIQLNSQADIIKNRAIIEDAIQAASEAGAKLVVLPENALMMGNQHELAKKHLETIIHYHTLSKEYNVHLVTGTTPCPERPDGTPVPDGKYRQTSLLFSNTGKLIARYDKIHLFRATVQDGVGSYDEGRTFEAGDKVVVADCLIDGVRVGVGLAVCFDLRFPQLFQALRQKGADIIVVPSAFTYATGQAHWQSLLTARALDSQCLIVGATQGGTHTYTHNNKTHTRKTWGHAMLMNANGKVINSSNQTELRHGDFTIVYGDFDPEQQKIIRQDLPIFECQRQWL